jgi:hypothetical protein
VKLSLRAKNPGQPAMRAPETNEDTERARHWWRTGRPGDAMRYLERSGYGPERREEFLRDVGVRSPEVVRRCAADGAWPERQRSRGSRS